MYVTHKRTIKIILVLLLLTIFLNATGSPYANVKLTPRASNYAGEVLFQTYSDINTHGSYTCKMEKFGWLVVSARGLWDEQIAYDTSEIYDKDCRLRDKKKYEAYKTGKVFYEKSDKVLQKILDTYYFETTQFKNKKYKVLELKPKQTCFTAKCIDKLLLQKSVEGLEAKELMSSNQNMEPLRSSFYFKGVALFKTPFYIDEETTKHSKNDNRNAYVSSFNLPILTKGRSYESTFVDTLVFVEPIAFIKYKNEVESVVYDIIELLTNPTVKSIDQLNSKYIHPSYGFYNIFRIGVMDSMEHYLKLDSSDLPSKKKPPTISSIFFHFYVYDNSFNPAKLKWKNNYYDCASEKWDNEGIFIDNNTYEIKYNQDFLKFSDENKKRIESLLKGSIRVVITESDTIFELKKIDGRWYIILMDGVCTDCSA